MNNESASCFFLNGFPLECCATLASADLAAKGIGLSPCNMFSPGTPPKKEDLPACCYIVAAHHINLGVVLGVARA